MEYPCMLLVWILRIWSISPFCILIIQLLCRALKLLNSFVNTFFYVNVFKSTPKNVTRLHLLLGRWIFCHHISWSDMCCKVAVLWGNNYQLSLLHYLFLWFLCNMCLPKYMTYHFAFTLKFSIPYFCCDFFCCSFPFVSAPCQGSLQHFRYESVS